MFFKTGIPTFSWQRKQNYDTPESMTFIYPVEKVDDLSTPRVPIRSIGTYGMLVRRNGRTSFKNKGRRSPSATIFNVQGVASFPSLRGPPPLFATVCQTVTPWRVWQLIAGIPHFLSPIQRNVMNYTTKRCLKSAQTTYHHGVIAERNCRDNKEYTHLCTHQLFCGYFFCFALTLLVETD